MSGAYEPSTNLASRIGRKLTAFRARNTIQLPTGKAVISFTFDDCPKTGIENGVSVLEAEGWQSTIYVSCGLFDVENHHGKMMNGADAAALHSSGHEIGEHTFSHLDGSQISLGCLKKDIERNQSKLADLGVPPSQTFAYPFGVATSKMKSALSKQFKGARGVRAVSHHKQVDLNQIGSVPVFESTINQAIAAIQKTASTGGWLTFFTHDVRDEPSEWGCTPAGLQKIIKAVKNTNAEILTIRGAIESFGDAA